MKKDRVKDFGIALSFSNIFFLKQWILLILPSSNEIPISPIYQALSAYPATYIGLMGSVLCLATGLFVVVRFLKKKCPPFVYELWILFYLVALIYPYNHACYILREQHFAPGTVLRVLKESAGALGPLVPYLLSGCLIAVGIRWRRSISVGAQHFFILLVPFVLFTFLPNLIVLKDERTWKFYLPGTQDLVRSNSLQRVVVFVFDEWSYRTTFEDTTRIPPEVAKFRASAFSATHAYPPAKLETKEIISSILLGRRTHSGPYLVRESSKLQVDVGESVIPLVWREQENLFTKLERAHARTAISGWYLPYCRLVGNSASYCSRYPHFLYDTFPYSPVLSRAIAGMFQDSLKFRFSERNAHLRTYLSILEDARVLATDPNYDFVFIHWPIPHFPQIYDARNATFNTTDTQSKDPDNVSLLDRTLSDLRKNLEETGQWDSTVVFLLSDHALHPVFNCEERNDCRVPFLVRFPGQREALTYDPPISTLLTHAAILKIVTREIQRPEDLALWLKNVSP